MEFFEKKPDGTYDFTDYGMYMAYYYALQKLVSHYLQSGYNLPPEKISPIIKNLYPFIAENIKEIDDYLNKLPEIAGFIGEKNPQKFATFISRNFLSVLEKSKESLRQKELPKIQNRLDNPYYAIGDQILELFGDLFRKSRPLVYPPEAGMEATIVQEDNPVVSAPEKREDPMQTMPGLSVLKKYSPLFAAAQRLDTASILAGNKPMEEDTESEEEPTSDEHITTPVSRKMPGEVVLAQWRSLFASASPLRMPASGETSSAVAEIATISTVPRQFTLREYASLTGKINQFVRNKDNAGYNAWYQTVPIKYRVLMNLNSIHQRSLKGQHVDWDGELYQISQKTAWETDVLEKIKEEVIAYREIIDSIQSMLRDISARYKDPGLSALLYGQMITIFENDGDIKQKSMALKMTLLQIVNSQEKKELEDSSGKLLDRLRDLFHID